MECHYNYVLTNNNFCSTVVLIEQDFKFCQFQFFLFLVYIWIFKNFENSYFVIGKITRMFIFFQLNLATEPVNQCTDSEF